jgi:hypothetical protein
MADEGSERRGGLYADPQSRQSAKLFLQSSELGVPRPPPAGECAPPPFGSGGGGHSRYRERGWGSPNSDGGTYTVVLCIYKYFVCLTIEDRVSLQLRRGR